MKSENTHCATIVLFGVLYWNIIIDSSMCTSKQHFNVNAELILTTCWVVGSITMHIL